ncbi:MAG: hypothetical protein M0Q53_02505 [Prolixibacteraceae bacterium]|jgi:hypothetical protein|nr:hypothetical protein [Prolixibacteraceae bacterium]
MHTCWLGFAIRARTIAPKTCLHNSNTPGMSRTYKFHNSDDPVGADLQSVLLQMLRQQGSILNYG